MRTRLCVESSGVQTHLREIVLRDKPASMLEASPKGTVPVLVQSDGTVIDESLDIALWAVENSDPELLLEPTAGNKDEMLKLIGMQDEQFKPNLDTYKYHFHSDKDVSLAARDRATAFLNSLENQLQKQFLFGEHISLADLCILPFIRQFAHVDKVWFWEQDFPKTITWLDTFLISERFKSIMTKYAVWVDGDEPVLFPANEQDVA